MGSFLKREWCAEDGGDPAPDNAGKPSFRRAPAQFACQREG